MVKVVPKPRRGEDDLVVLHPDLVLPIAGEEWTLREYGFIEAARLSSIATPVAAAIAAGEQPHLPTLIGLIAEAADKDVLRVAGLSDPDFDSLVAAWREVNARLFLPDPSRRAFGKPARWADIYAALIEAGHDRASISRYTSRQISLFFGAAQRAERRRRAAMISSINLGFAGGKDAKKALKELQKDDLT